MANSDEETSQLAPRLRTTPQLLRSLPIGSFATFIRDTTRQAVTLKIPIAGVLRAPQMTRAEQSEVQARMRQLYSFKVDAPPVTSPLADALRSFAKEEAPKPPSPPKVGDRW